MGKTKVKESKKPLTLSKVVVYILLILLAITIIIPVGWVFVASVKQNSEFYGSPWVLPEKIYFQNFIDAWEKASMGTYMLNSVIVTALALLLLIVISLPAAYVLSRFKFKTSKFWNVLFMAPTPGPGQNFPHSGAGLPGYRISTRTGPPRGRR